MILLARLSNLAVMSQRVNTSLNQR